MAKHNNKTPRQPAAPQKPGGKSSLTKPIAILAIAVAGAVALAIFMSSGEAEPTQPAVDITDLASQSGGGHLLGPENPAVTLVEYGDFQCPHCAEFHHWVKELMRRMPSELELEFHHYPLGVFPHSFTAAYAAEAAAEQGRYWDMHDALFETQSGWSSQADAEQIFISMAGQLGLDVDRFVADMNDPSIQSRVLADRLRGDALQISGTPTFFVNGQRLVNLPGSPDQFEDILRSVMGQ